MKQFVIFLLLCVPSMYGQNPLEGKWITNSLLCDFKGKTATYLCLHNIKIKALGIVLYLKRTTKISIPRITLPLVATTVSPL